MSVVVLLVLGLVVGALARLVLPGRQSLPIWLTLVIGAGSLLLATLVLPGRRPVFEAVIGVVIATAVLALTADGLHSHRRTRV